MATPTIKKETISITLEKGNGTILVNRPGNTGNTVGLIHQFTYTGDAAMDLMHALGAARRRLTEHLAATQAAKPAARPTARPAAAAADDEPEEGEPEEGEPEEGEQEEGEQEGGEPEEGEQPAELTYEPFSDDEPTDGAPPDLEPIADDDADLVGAQLMMF